jgi:hypothetical protein
MRFISIVAAMFAVMILSCATKHYSVGKDFDETLIPYIEKNITTQDVLLAMFGEPYVKSILSEQEQKWLYHYESGSLKSQSFVLTTKVKTIWGRKKVLKVLLRDGIVVDYTFTKEELGP